MPDNASFLIPHSSFLADRRAHEGEVRGWLQQQLGGPDWQVRLPPGSGDETYIAENATQCCFVKVGAAVERARALAAVGLAPPVWAAGQLAGGAPVLAQPYLAARRPRPCDFQAQWEPVAGAVRILHHDPGVRATLPGPPPATYRAAAWARLAVVRQRWAAYRAQVPTVAGWVAAALDQLDAACAAVTGDGLVAAHNDLCNANWLLTPAGRWYIVDLEAMGWDDPASDLGPLLWWYYPPAQRARFLARAGVAADAGLRHRLWLRTALHCLAITLPRPNSWDGWDPAGWPAGLTDFRAALAGLENPQGYEA